MSAETRACAPFDVTWPSIDWVIKVQRFVRRLQTRIVKAAQAGRHNQAKALQWLLTHSFSGKALAVKRVTENKGKNTPAVDKVIGQTPEAKINAIASLQRRGYSPLPLRRVWIPKKNGKTRPLGIPVMKCRAMQALHLLALEPIAETPADRNSYGFRPQRSTADAGAICVSTSIGRAGHGSALDPALVVTVRAATAPDEICTRAFARYSGEWSRFHASPGSKLSEKTMRNTRSRRRAEVVRQARVRRSAKAAEQAAPVCGRQFTRRHQARRLTVRDRGLQSPKPQRSAVVGAKALALPRCAGDCFP